MNKVLGTLAVIIAVLLGYIYYTPYMAVNGLIKGVEAQDVDKVSQYIDFGTLKANMNDQFQAVMMKKLMADPRAQNDKRVTAFAVSMLSKMVDGLTSVIASPTGMTKMLGGTNPIDDSQHQSNNDGTVVTKLRDGKGEYLEMNRFQLTVMSNRNYPIKMIFERQGLTEWKMKKMIFPEESFNR